MLISFKFKNFKSFKDEANFSMIKSNTRKHPEHVCHASKTENLNLLRGALIYGPNASGKSTFVDALEFFRDTIFNRTPEKPYGNHYKLASKINYISEFDLEFSISERTYLYTLHTAPNKIVKEELYQTKSRTDDLLIYSRDTDSVKLGKYFDRLDEKDYEFVQFVARGTPESDSLICEFLGRNVLKIENLTFFYDILTWFSSSLMVLSPNHYPSENLLELKLNELQNSMGNFLSDADTGIDNVELVKMNDFKVTDQLLEDFDINLEEGQTTLLPPSPNGSRIALKMEDGEITAHKIMVVHKSEDGAVENKFDLHEESDGTNRLIQLMPLIHDLTQGKSPDFPKVVVIDEIDRSMHPLLTRKILKDILEGQANSHTQIITTTHDISLLDLDLFRQDEIWFTQKNEMGASELYSLDEFNERFDKDIRKQYLHGRYGAVPFRNSILGV